MAPAGLRFLGGQCEVVGQGKGVRIKVSSLHVCTLWNCQMLKQVVHLSLKLTWADQKLLYLIENYL